MLASRHHKFCMISRRFNVTLWALKVALSVVLTTSQISYAERLEPYRCGSALEDARCLLRRVFEYGKLGERLTRLPAPLEDLIGRPVLIATQSFRTYLTARGIDQYDLGGGFSEPLSKTPRGDSADYLVIHDTSTPVYKPNEEFPSMINESVWNQTLLQSLVRKQNAHVFIDRTGRSKTAIDFASPLRTTLFEREQERSRRGLFLGVELIQPRKLDARGIDATAPRPGFTEAQLDRLALTYIAASMRRGIWMIPAFHAAIDEGLHNAHDDPQNFDLSIWAQRLYLLLDTISKH